MTKYKELKKKIFEYDWFINTDYDVKVKLIYNIAKLETENFFDDVVVIRPINYSKEFDVYTISQLVKKDNRKMIMIINLTRRFNSTFFNYVGLISEYDFK